MTAPTRLRILVEPAIFRYGRCGMTRYYAALCRALIAAGHDVRLPLLLSGSDYIRGSLGGPVGTGRLAGKATALLWRLTNTWFLRAVQDGDYDVLLITSPQFDAGFLDHVGSRPWVMVVHDTMRCVLGPDGLFDPAGENADRLAFLARRASGVVCISQATRADLLALCDVAPDRVGVVPTGLLFPPLPEPPADPLDLPSRFLLFTGERTGRKNFRFCVTALAPLFARMPDLALVCTGRFSRWEHDMLAVLGLRRQVRAIPAADAVLDQLYRRAEALLYPSLYEGFGLPVLEAMARGCPVVAAPVSAVPEIGGDALLYARPDVASDWPRAVDRLLADPALAADLRRKGLERARLFSMEAMVDGVLDRCRQAIADPSAGHIEMPNGISGP